ncbi:hypothetical protein J4526_04685 [Desulfurococcaceae archaeon MEX13E-LK6-19]|nr:hypothetical protein J4526_04685 [Desulfurococcaceae archaeon MEX13E-LK6-19]
MLKNKNRVSANKECGKRIMNKLVGPKAVSLSYLDGIELLTELIYWKMIYGKYKGALLIGSIENSILHYLGKILELKKGVLKSINTIPDQDHEDNIFSHEEPLYPIIFLTRNIDAKNKLLFILNKFHEIAIVTDYKDLDDLIQLLGKTNNLEKTIVLARFPWKKSYRYVVLVFNGDTINIKHLPGPFIILEGKRIELYKKHSVRAERSKTIAIVHDFSFLYNLLKRYASQEEIQKINFELTRFVDEECFTIRKPSYNTQKHCRRADIEGFFEDKTGLKNCVLLKTPFHAYYTVFSRINKKNVVMPESNWPGTMSIASFFKEITILHADINIVDKRINEKIYYPPEWKSRKNSNGRAIVISIPSILGTNLLDMLEDNGSEIVIDSMTFSRRLLKGDYIVFILRKIVPVDDLSATIVCSDYHIQVREEFLLSTDLDILGFFVENFNYIMKRRDELIEQYINAVNSIVDALNPPIPYSGYIVLFKRDCRVRTIFHKNIYGKMKGLYGILLSGLEEQSFLENSIRELVCGDSATPGVKSSNL